MKPRHVWLALGALLIAAAGAGGGYWYANMRAEMREYDRQAAAPTPAGKKILYWHDPMVPQQRFDKPGKSPFMDMQLVPVYADDDGSSGAGVKISPLATQNLGVRVAEAVTTALSRSVEATGIVAFDEGAIETVQARVSGWIEKLHVRNPNDTVAAGAPLASIFAPEWLGAQEEFLAVKRSGNAELAAAARARLAFLGIPEAQIGALEREDRANPRVTLSSPRAGVLLPLGPETSTAGAFAKEGMQVTPGMTLFRVASLASVWVIADVPEAQSAVLRVGAPVEVRTQALPDRKFRGSIAVVLPEVNAATRTVRARIRVDNPGGTLRPGMFAAVALGGAGKRDAIVVPSEAIIATGTRKLVMVAGEKGRFSQREIATGMDARHGGVDVTEIVKGLAAGERVVVSGQFLIDSEASLKGAPAPPAAPILPASGAAQPGAAAEHIGQARVENITGDAVTLSHAPIASIKWPAMTMDFKPPQGGLPPDVRKGDRVDFSFVAEPGGEYRITRIAPRTAVPAAAELKK